MKKLEKFILLFAIILFIDRITKSFLSESCLSIFCIKKALNPGAAFGIFPYPATLILISAAVLIAIAYFWKIQKIRLALTLVAAGTAGNLLDRILYGKVIDIFSIANSSSFNISDISNLVGALLLIIYIVGKPSKSK